LHEVDIVVVIAAYLVQNQVMDTFSMRTLMLFVSMTFLASGCMSTNKLNPDQNQFPTLQTTEANIHRDFESQQGKLQMCWQNQRKAFKNRPVTVNVKVGFVGDGVVHQVSIPKVSIRNVAFENCVKQKVKAFAFKDVIVPTDIETGITFPLKIGTTVKQ
jgi:hypothetical protein